MKAKELMRTALILRHPVCRALRCDPEKLLCRYSFFRMHYRMKDSKFRLDRLCMIFPNPTGDTAAGGSRSCLYMQDIFHRLNSMSRTEP